MNKYQKLRSDINEIESGKGIARFYSGAIFNQTSWYASRFEEPIVDAEAHSGPVSIERPSAEASPTKVEVFSSLAKKVEESGSVKSKFGNIVKDSSPTFHGSQLKINININSYQEVIQNIDPNFKFEDFKGISTLIVGESRIEELTNENLCFKTKHDSSELLGKMIIPMKLEEGDFVRSSLFGKNDEEVLQNLLCEIYLLKPKVVISLGAVSTNFLYGKKEKLSKIHGSEIERVVECNGETTRFALFPIFHPDLLEINPSMKRTAWMDLQKVMKFLGKL